MRSFQAVATKCSCSVCVYVWFTYRLNIDRLEFDSVILCTSNVFGMIIFLLLFLFSLVSRIFFSISCSISPIAPRKVNLVRITLRNELWNFCGRTFQFKERERERENTRKNTTITTTTANNSNDLLMDLLFFNSFCVLTSRLSGWCVFCVSFYVYISACVHCRKQVSMYVYVRASIRHEHWIWSNWLFSFLFPFSIVHSFFDRRVCSNRDYFLCNSAQMYWRISFSII